MGNASFAEQVETDVEWLREDLAACNIALVDATDAVVVPAGVWKAIKGGLVQSQFLMEELAEEKNWSARATYTERLVRDALEEIRTLEDEK